MAADMDKNLEKPKAGEAGWLVSMAEDLAREQEFGASGDTVVSSGEMSSRRSSQGPSQELRSSGSVAAGESSSSTLRLLSGSEPPSQVSSQKLSQSQDNSQPMSQPSSIDVLASQTVSSQLLALAVADSQVSVGTYILIDLCDFILARQIWMHHNKTCWCLVQEGTSEQLMPPMHAVTSPKRRDLLL